MTLTVCCKLVVSAVDNDSNKDTLSLESVVLTSAFYNKSYSIFNDTKKALQWRELLFFFVFFFFVFFFFLLSSHTTF